MELFQIDRYDEGTNVSEDPDKEKKILEKLQKSIKKKKRKLNEIDENSAGQISTNESSQNENHSIGENAETTANDIVETSTKKPENSEDSATMLVLGDEKFTKRPKVDMILPPWLAYPTIISSDLTVKQDSIETDAFLSSAMKKSLTAMSIKCLFPVQKTVIPWIVNVHQKPAPFRPRDICVSAPTGSGKTLAYAVPIVQLLSNRVERKIRALIVLPVNELAVQVVKVFKKLCESTGLTCVLLSRFVPFEKEQNQLIEEFNGKIYSKVDIVVATTGRLVEHLHSTKGFSLHSLQFLVMDEADRIMEQIHNNWLYHLDSHVKENSDTLLSGRTMPLCYRALSNEAVKQPHKLLFSATLSQDPEKLQNLRLFQPKLFTSIVRPFDYQMRPQNEQRRGEFIGKFTTPAELTEKYCLTEAKLKPLTLYALITENKWNRFLCFTNSGEAAHRLSYVLQYLLGNNMKIEELSSGLSAQLRHSVLSKFQSSKIDGLICSDALARGIDIPNVDVIISYDAPRHVKTYIHRVGRTARAGKPGLAVTILAENELNGFNNIIKEGGKPMMEELKLTGDVEERKARDYAKAVEHMQLALKREQQHRIVRSVNEKFKSNKANESDSIFGKLQNQIQPAAPSNWTNELNIPESWKWENQQQINLRKERKSKKKPKVK